VDVDEYAAARYGRLVEHAVALGCSESEAPSYVDRVLHDRRKAIRRSEDPDPLVREALRDALCGGSGRRAWTAPAVAFGALTVAAAAAAVLTYQPATTPMPSLFGLDGSEARQLLEEHGYDVDVRPRPSCAHEGRVIGSAPTQGRPVRAGATVTVRVAVPARWLHCDGDPSRRAALELVRFAPGQRPGLQLTGPDDS